MQSVKKALWYMGTYLGSCQKNRQVVSPSLQAVPCGQFGSMWHCKAGACVQCAAGFALRVHCLNIPVSACKRLNQRAAHNCAYFAHSMAQHGGITVLLSGRPVCEQSVCSGVSSSCLAPKLAGSVTSPCSLVFINSIQAGKLLSYPIPRSVCYYSPGYRMHFIM